MSNHQIGYARISTSKQTTDQQRDALEAAGVTRIFEDVMSGSRADRPGLKTLLEYAREGDTITVVALDRLGRSMTHVILTIEELQSRGILVRSLREGVDFTQPVGRMLAGIFASLAEYERALIRERAEAAREAARIRGKQTGRPRALDEAKIRQAWSLREAGFSPSEIASTLKCSRATVYRAFEAAKLLIA
ncbi:DNA invertase Pin-like site-specific DNA recombinase [Microbacterium sp. AG1240]|uniref:recombinase family protein n=1 Tax=Microbacterium sp. AG1240 TaxID=2183992 RepID=UPI000F0E6F0B|nr:recombinase family protein [Microbacterium sp. AG1240]RKT31448.1 DNA invertase Pin-like site-specific DNA recombinase [Microbacterium sp. AG1240]